MLQINIIIYYNLINYNIYTHENAQDEKVKSRWEHHFQMLSVFDKTNV